MNKEKILRIGFVADGGDAGGARTHLLTLLSLIPDYQVECYFFSLGEGALSHKVEGLERVHFFSYPLKSKADLRVLKSLQQWSNDHQIDVVHTHGLKANMYARLAFYRYPLPIVTTYHSHPLYDYRHLLIGMLFTLIDQLTLHRSNHFIAVSYEISTQLERRGISRDRISIIKNGVDAYSSPLENETQSRSEIRTKWNLPHDAVVVGSLGRLVKVKGYHEMLTIFKKCLDKANTPLYLMIIGGGEEKLKLEKKAKKLGIDPYIRWAGYQKNPYPYVLACDIMLFTPRSEALGIAILESMIAKRPVVSKKVGGIQELLLDRYNGRIRSGQNELVEAILELTGDSDQRKALAENGAQMVQRFFACSRMVEKTVKLYRNIKKSRIHILGLPVDNLSKKEVLSRLADSLPSSPCQQVITLNLEMISRASRDLSFRNTITEADLVIPDGISIVRLARRINEFISEKIPGIELAQDLLDVAEKKEESVFFLGSTENALLKLKERLKIQRPGLAVAGMHHGYFEERDEDALVESINQSGADILFVGMGAGRQEELIHRNKTKLNARIAMGVGGSLDIWAGIIQRAPRWAIKLNIEWLYRILCQPRLRLKRFLVTLPIFFKASMEKNHQLRRLLISGYYGYGNIGDETILQTLTQSLQCLSRQCSLQVSVLSANPHMTTTLADEVFSSHRFNLYTLLTELARCKGLISGGGGLIQDITSKKSPWYYLGIIALARIMGKKVFVYANGIGPLHSPLNRFLSKWVLGRTQLLTVRDEHSRQMLHSWGIKHCKLTADPIFSYQPAEVQDPYQRYNDFIAVSLGPSRETNFKIPYFAEFLDKLSQTTGKVCVFTPFYRAYDSRFSQKIIEQMKQPAVLIDTFLLPEEMFSLLSRASVGVGMRLHFLVFLSLLHKPLLPVIYDPKVEAFCDQLSLPFFWSKQSSIEDMLDKICSFAHYIPHPVSYKSSLALLSERNHLNQEYLKEFVCS